MIFLCSIKNTFIFEYFTADIQVYCLSCNRLYGRSHQTSLYRICVQKQVFNDLIIMTLNYNCFILLKSNVNILSSTDFRKRLPTRILRQNLYHHISIIALRSATPRQRTRLARCPQQPVPTTICILKRIYVLKYILYFQRGAIV